MLTVQGSYELRVDLEDFDNGTAFAHYGSFGVGLFSVDPEEDGYPVSISDYSGTAGRAAGQGDTRGPLGQGEPMATKPPCWGISCLLWHWRRCRLHPCSHGEPEAGEGLWLGLCRVGDPRCPIHHRGPPLGCPGEPPGVGDTPGRGEGQKVLITARSPWRQETPS